MGMLDDELDSEVLLSLGVDVPEAQHHDRKTQTVLAREAPADPISALIHGAVLRVHLAVVVYPVRSLLNNGQEAM